MIQLKAYPTVKDRSKTFTDQKGGNTRTKETSLQARNSNTPQVEVQQSPSHSRQEGKGKCKSIIISSLLDLDIAFTCEDSN
jgi:hypothetical protein